MDLREVLTRLTEENEDLRRLAKRVEVISAFAEEDLRRFRERTEVERLLRQERWEDTRRQIQEAYAKGARRRQAQLEESPAPPDRCQADGPCQHPGGSGGLPGPAGSCQGT